MLSLSPQVTHNVKFLFQKCLMPFRDTKEFPTNSRKLGPTVHFLSTFKRGLNSYRIYDVPGPQLLLPALVLVHWMLQQLGPLLYTNHVKVDPAKENVYRYFTLKNLYLSKIVVYPIASTAKMGQVFIKTKYCTLFPKRTNFKFLLQIDHCI